METAKLKVLQTKLNEIHSSGKTYTLVEVNMKNFRYYALKYGNFFANNIIEQLVATTQENLQKSESVFSFYADTIVLFLQSPADERLVQERLIPLLDCFYRLKDDRVYRNLFFSMGICEITKNDLDFLELLTKATVARKQSTTLENRSHCLEIANDEILAQYIAEKDIEAEIAEAYKADNFVSYLQPKIDLKTESIVGAEVLIRWFDAAGHAIPLAKFLPILEKNGYISLVDLDSFDRNCKLLEQRISNNQPVVPISFNISKSNFYRPDIVEQYIRIFEQYNLPKSLIEIEFMESISMQDTTRLKEIVQQFKAYGFCCSLDDFGNGYSSFNVLLNTMFDNIKMDRQFFVENLNGDGKLIIKTVIDLIHSLKMKVIAEGVEDEEDITYLKKCGCDYVQGFYYDPPMPTEQFYELLSRQHCYVK